MASRGRAAATSGCHGGVGGAGGAWTRVIGALRRYGRHAAVGLARHGARRCEARHRDAAVRPRWGERRREAAAIFCFLILSVGAGRSVTRP